MDRAALIEAAAEAIYERRRWSSNTQATVAVDSVLPLIADAIEAAPIPFTKDSDRMAWGHGVQRVLAMLVRSLAEDDEQ